MNTTQIKFPKLSNQFIVEFGLVDQDYSVEQWQNNLTHQVISILPFNELNGTEVTIEFEDDRINTLNSALVEQKNRSNNILIRYLDGENNTLSSNLFMNMKIKSIEVQGLNYGGTLEADVIFQNLLPDYDIKIEEFSEEGQSFYKFLKSLTGRLSIDNQSSRTVRKRVTYTLN